MEDYEIYFTASQVASLIGKHKYRPACRSLLLTAYSAGNLKTRKLCKELMNTDVDVKKAFAILQKEKNALNELQDLDKAVNEASLKKSKIEKEKIEQIAKDATEKTKKFEEESVKAFEKAQEQIRLAKEIEQKKEEDAKSNACEKAKIFIVNAAVNTQISPDSALKIAEDFVSTSTFLKLATPDFKEENVSNKFSAVNESEQKVTEVVQNIISAEQFIKEINAVKQKSLSDSQKQIDICRDSSKKFIQESSLFENKAASLKIIADVKELEKIAEHAVLKKRGRDEEEEVLNEAEIRMQKKIEERNSETFSIPFENYRIGGKVDGIIKDDCIVEVKTRRNWFKQPPEYDIIQLRVYLKMLDKCRGLLIEENRDLKFKRETIIENSEKEWEEINIALKSVALKLNNASKEDIKQWSLQVISNEEIS